MPSKNNKPYNPAHAADETVKAIPMACADEGAARTFLEDKRWGDCPCCAKCASTNVYAMKGRDGGREANGRWRCRDCNALYTVRTGTVMEDSRVPLRHWCYAFWRACTSKKGVSALEIRRQTGLSYKTALFLLHRVRFAMQPGLDGGPLKGTVEADETFIGGKPRYPVVYGRDGRARNDNSKTIHERMVTVFAAVERGGRVRTKVLPRVTSATIEPAVRELVDRSARLMTDECRAYLRVGAQQQGGHKTIRHKNRIYAEGEVTTNTVEGFFALLKRGVHGIYHNVSKEHLHRYLSEFQYRYDNREMGDGERTAKLVRTAQGKRLMYKDYVVRETDAA
jgi:transposase-like protein